MATRGVYAGAAHRTAAVTLRIVKLLLRELLNPLMVIGLFVSVMWLWALALALFLRGCAP